MKHYLQPVLVIAFGLALLVSSVVWNRLAPPSSAWTQQQAEAYAAASQRLHMAATAEVEEDNLAEHQAAQQHYAQLRKQLDQARGGQAVLAMLLQMLGVGAGLIGAVWLIMRQNQAEDARRKSA